MYMKLLTKSVFFYLLFFSITTKGKNTDLMLKSGKLSPVAIESSIHLNTLFNESSDHYVIIQFNETPTNEEKEKVKINGVQLLEYIPHQAFIAYSSNPSEIEISKLNIRTIIPYTVELKSEVELKQGIFPHWTIQENQHVDLLVDKHLNADNAILESKFNLIGIQILSKSSNDEYYEIRIQKNNIDKLLEIAEVKFVDFIPAPPEKDDTRARSLHRGNLLDSDHPLGKKYDGSGVSVAIADDGEIGPHIDTKGRVNSFAAPSVGSHGDMTTGITMGAGNLDPRYRGMATDAFLYYYSIGGYPHIGQAISNFTSRGVVVTSTSYSEGCNAGYTSTTRQVDQQTRQYPSILHVFSAGNSAGSSCGYTTGSTWGTITGGRKQGKAVIATGNLDYKGILTASSSRGPATDGRIKPDICSNGTNQMSTDPNNSYAPGGGTSAAAPGIAGLAVQMYDGYRQLNGGANPESGLIKSAMLNTAHDIGNPGPDFFYGWGRVNAHRAMKLIEENRYLKSNISQGASNTHTVTLTSGIEQLKLMIYWTDFEASTNASQDLVNNIDLRVVKPNGDTLLPWVLDPTPNPTNLSRNAVRGVDNLNNVEQVTIDGATAGTYTILINGTSIPQGPQDYFLLWEELTDDIQVTYPAGGEPFVPGEQETIRWDATDNSGTFTIQYSVNAGNTWNTIASGVSGSLRYRDWTVPNVITGSALIRVTRGSKTGQSANPFTIVPLPNYSIQYVCSDSVKLSWPSIPNVSEYEISMLGAKHMDSIGRTTSNSYIIRNLNLLNDNWISVKALNPSLGIVGRRATATMLPKTILNCPIGYDFNITQFNSPNSATVSSCSFNKLPIKITINNNGDSVLSNIPMRLIANNVTYHDTMPGPIASRSFHFFTFKDSIPLNTGTLNISVVNDLITDENSSNDSISITTNVIGSQVFTIPYSNDFESFSLCGTSNNCGATTCNLNGGWVNLVNGSEDVYDMRTNSGSTPSNNTGPTTDHNPGTGTGKYIYSEASGSCSNQESIVLSPCFDLRGTISPELSFWYHMYGGDMGILRVDVLYNGSWINNIITPIFGNKGNSWQEQKINLSAYNNGKITIRFRVVTGGGFESDLALDDISIIDNSIGINEVQKTNFSVYPNPNTGLFNLRLDKVNNNLIQVFNMSGQNVFSAKAKSSTIQIDLSHLSKGIYFLNIEGIERKEKIIIY